jgi:hypothetical protein
VTDTELLDYMGDDASKWASEFCKIARDLGHNIDEGWMIGWFANAIEHSYDLRKRRENAATPSCIEVPDQGEVDMRPGAVNYVRR